MMPIFLKATIFSPLFTLMDDNSVSHLYDISFSLFKGKN